MPHPTLALPANTLPATVPVEIVACANCKTRIPASQGRSCPTCPAVTCGQCTVTCVNPDHDHRDRDVCLGCVADHGSTCDQELPDDTFQVDRMSRYYSWVA